MPDLQTGDMRHIDGNHISAASEINSPPQGVNFIPKPLFRWKFL